MSDGDRGKRSKTELAIFAGLAAAFIALILFGAVPQHLSYGDQAARNAENHERWANDQIGRNCVAIERPAFADCVEDARATSEERQREERDLEAQRKMALWTAIMGAMAVIGVGLSGFGVYLIWRTWDATREAADNSRKTLDRYIYRERAMLRLGNARFRFLDDLPVPAGFQAEIINHGPSPGDLQSVEWEYLSGPVWPEKLKFEKFTSTIVTSENDPATPHLGCENVDALPLWLAVTLNYLTLGDESYKSHGAFEIRYEPPDGYGPGGYHASSVLRISDQPFDT